MAQTSVEPGDSPLQTAGRTTIADQQFADGSHVTKNYDNHLLVRMVAKEVTFSKVDFSYTTFDACYLRKCFFDECNFTGCRFSNCNMDAATFGGCNFNYATFDTTLVDASILHNSCPSWDNLKLRFARSLRTNYQSLGDSAGANQAILVELDATQAHLLKAWKSKESYYRNKYRGLDRAKQFASWLKFQLLHWLWGNGESWIRLSLTIVIALVSIAMVDVFATKNYLEAKAYFLALLDAPPLLLGVLRPPEYSDLYVAALMSARLVFFGLFMSLIIKRFNRR